MKTYRNELIKGKMAELGYTIESLSKKTGLSVDTIFRIRIGQNASVKTLALIADTLGLEMSQLFTPKAERDVA